MSPEQVQANINLTETLPDKVLITVVSNDEDLSFKKRYHDILKDVDFNIPVTSTNVKDGRINLDNVISNNSGSINFLGNASPELIKSVENLANKTKSLVLQIGNKEYLGPDGSLEKGDTAPIILNGRMMVPARLIAENLGFEVGYDDKTKIITFQQEKKEIRIQIGNETMEINDDGVIKKTILDSPPIIDENSRTLVPIRAIAETFGASVQWNGDTKTVYIGYTEDQKNILEMASAKVETADAKSVFRASQFMAGGEFITNGKINPLVLKDKKSGAVVVFSDQDLAAIKAKVSPLEKMGYKLTNLDQFYLALSVINKINKAGAGKLTATDFVYVLNGEAYVFTDENLNEGPNKNKIVKYDKDGKKIIVENDKAGYTSKTKVTWSEKWGICEFDGTRIVRSWNLKTGKFEDLPKVEFVGTLKQRTVHNLERYYQQKWGQGVTNILGLDYQDILEYKKTGSDANCNSFKVIEVGNDLGFIYMMGKFGFQEAKTLENMKFAVAECNRVDKTLMTGCVENGLNVVTVDLVEKPTFVGGTANWRGTYSSGMVFLNEPKMLRANDLARVLIEESFGLYTDNHVRVDGKLEIDGKVSLFTFATREQYKQGKIEEIISTYWPDLETNLW